MDELLYETRDGIGFITLNRPQARNALTFPMYERLREIAAGAGDDPALKVLVITGAGEKAFAAGTDISQFSSFRTPEDALAYEERIDGVLTALEECPKPTIAAIAGAATGGGAAIAGVCDMRIAAANARFGFPIAKTLGNCLSMANLSALVHAFGGQRVRRMLLLAQLIDAEEAHACGFVHAVCGPDGLDAEAGRLVAALTALAPVTQRVSKQALRRLAQASLPDGDDLIRACYASGDFREGVAAFGERRAPRWRGE